MLLKLVLSIDLVILLIDACKFNRYIKWTILIKEIYEYSKKVKAIKDKSKIIQNG